MTTLLSVLAVFTVFAAVASVVSLNRYGPPSVDWRTSRRLARSLNRARLPPPGPDRAPGVELARSRAAAHWTVAMLSSLAVSQFLVARTVEDIDARFFYAVGTLLLVASLMTLYQLLASQRALRHADTTQRVPRH